MNSVIRDTHQREVLGGLLNQPHPQLAISMRMVKSKACSHFCQKTVLCLTLSSKSIISVSLSCTMVYTWLQSFTTLFTYPTKSLVFVLCELCGAWDFRVRPHQLQLQDSTPLSLANHHQLYLCRRLLHCPDHPSPPFLIRQEISFQKYSMNTLTMAM